MLNNCTVSHSHRHRHPHNHSDTHTHTHRYTDTKWIGNRLNAELMLTASTALAATTTCRWCAGFRCSLVWPKFDTVWLKHRKQKQYAYWCTTKMHKTSLERHTKSFHTDGRGSEDAGHRVTALQEQWNSRTFPSTPPYVMVTHHAYSAIAMLLITGVASHIKF